MSKVNVCGFTDRQTISNNFHEETDITKVGLGAKSQAARCVVDHTVLLLMMMMGFPAKDNN